MPSGTDTIRIMKHTDLPPAAIPPMSLASNHTRARTRSLHDWLQLHRLPMLRTSVAMKIGDSQVVSTSTITFKMEPSTRSYDIAALAMIAFVHLINTPGNYVHSWTVCSSVGYI
jgi:hypothetical protein